ncbi:cytochrome c [Desulfomarina profundi]|uniref:Cytochrome c n=1 Tax=Desulfomarina profundi TaxID=2772557 RepID=A0A8D5JMX1_9BACT|nr:virulence protein RhuM/Fic/DOC family protein [Desulfomarina profundi]BCL62062.1 cytochrome c [Desulfomarina profundi]
MNQGQVIIYQSEDGSFEIDVRLKDEMVWLTQKQISDLFGAERSVVTKHINNVFRTGELEKTAVCAKFAHTATDGKTYQTNHYNLDVIIAVGYRVNARRGTRFRIWATSVLKDHLVNGYTLNQKRLAEKGTSELQEVLSLLSSTLETHGLVNDEGRAVLEIVSTYAATWNLLLQYDEDQLALPTEPDTDGVVPDPAGARAAIASLKADLLHKGEATELFGQERGEGLAAILGAVGQSFDGHDLYPGVALKAAHLLYFVIKDHPFSDGNKRIGAFLFLLFLRKNRLRVQRRFSNNALVALTLLIAASDPGQKDVLVRLITHLISGE